MMQQAKRMLQLCYFLEKIVLGGCLAFLAFPFLMVAAALLAVLLSALVPAGAAQITWLYDGVIKILALVQSVSLFVMVVAWWLRRCIPYTAFVYDGHHSLEEIVAEHYVVYVATKQQKHQAIGRHISARTAWRLMQTQLPEAVYVVGISYLDSGGDKVLMQFHFLDRSAWSPDADSEEQDRRFRKRPWVILPHYHWWLVTVDRRRQEEAFWPHVLPGSS